MRNTKANNGIDSGLLLLKEYEVIVPESALKYDAQEGLRFLKFAACLGLADAQVRLGHVYGFGELGCKFNPSLSLHYLKLAAYQGNPDAEYGVSEWMLHGSESRFEQDEHAAFMYTFRAANSGHSEAELAMGYFYEGGVDVKVNLLEARMWYQKAYEHGEKDALDRIMVLTQILTTERKRRLAISSFEPFI